MNFGLIAPYLTNPLVLIGFVLLLGFGVLYYLIRSNIIPTVTQRAGGRIVQTFLWGVFVIAVLIIVLGFGLEFYKTHLAAAPSVDANALVSKLFKEAKAATRAQVQNKALKKQLIEAVEELANLRNQKDAPPGINQAFALLKQGNTKAAEKIFQEIEDRKTAQGQTANKQAAAAARHIGALAYLHNTRKSLNAYRRATKLDPDNMQGWNMLGPLLMRTGALSNAEAAFRKVESLAKEAKSAYWRAAAYTNLGNVYQIRGDLDRAEGMYQKALEINEALGRKEGMAINYTNLGNTYQIRGDLDRAEGMYQKALEIDEAMNNKEGMAANYTNLGSIYKTRGDLDRAETMYHKALKIDEAMGNKEGMARNYYNLGIVYRTRGDLDQAKTMYRKALTLFEAIGAQPEVAQVRAALKDLSRDDC